MSWQEYVKQAKVSEEKFAKNLIDPVWANNYENMKEDMTKQEEEKRIYAEKQLEEISKLKIVFKKESDEKDQLYGSISKKEILNYLNEHRIKIKSDDLIIFQPIKSLGEHEIKINPYVDVSKVFKILVAKN